jgi:DNA-binding NtrC family response regulator
VLVVDDEPSILLLLERVLVRLGYRVTAVGRATEALEAFRLNPHDFDLVLTDLNMPGLDGIALAGEVHRVRPETPIVLMTGIGLDISQVGLAAAHGVRDTLDKPLQVADLGAAIRRALDGGIAEGS